ncbi:MAG TPA: methylated-DNA--[protein]-cysteine S-methyltransferase [Gemmatimonadaceae bacterium]|nr:methylated-DNA--[protein]-cysteine S-methyltransferase [Gemmatimonadaceae bacterium]
MTTRNADVVFVDQIETPIGPMVAAATNSDLMMLEYLERHAVPTTSLRLGDETFACAEGDSPVLVALRAQLAEYFDGRRTRFELSLRTPGTAFQQLVWSELQTIPPGSTTTYSAVAKAIGRPTAVRAVAGANGDNRIAIVIPCHRVIGADGKLTGYGGGLWRKQKLLDLETGALALV